LHGEGSTAAPPSVAQVAAALPGGDPLAAAIAAGETPSPDMVAAAGSKEGLKLWAAWACLAVVIAGVIAAVFLGGQALLFRRVPIKNPPEVLAAKSREILQKSGYLEPPVDRAFGFSADEEYFRYVRRKDRSAGRWDRMPSSAIEFWYRQSPRIECNHQGMDNRLLIPGREVDEKAGEVMCQEPLGGLLRYYYRQPA